MTLDATEHGETAEASRTEARRAIAALTGVMAMALAVAGFDIGSQIKQANIVEYKANGNLLEVEYAPWSQDCEPLRMRAIETSDSVTLDIVDWAPSGSGFHTLAQRICFTEFTLSEPLGDRELLYGAGKSVLDDWASVGR